MFVLHGAWLRCESDPHNGRLALWAEDLNEFLACLADKLDARRHPYAVSPDRVAELAAKLMGTPEQPWGLERPCGTAGFNADSGDPSSHIRELAAVACSNTRGLEATAFKAAASSIARESAALACLSAAVALLPVDRRGYPLPSYELARRLDATGHSSVPVAAQGGSPLAPFEVPVYTLSASDAASLLIKISKLPREAFDDVAIADDLRFFAEVIRFELSLLSAGKVVPVLEPCAGAADSLMRSRWCLLVNEDADVENYRLLVRSVPPVCRGFGRADASGELDPLSRSQVVRHFLAATTDALVRSWLADSDVAAGDTASGDGLGPENGNSAVDGMNAANGLSAADGTGASNGMSAAALQWLQSLRDPQHAVIAIDGAEEVEAFRQLSVQTTDWAASLSTGLAPSKFRTCFRLEPPVDPLKDNTWILRYFIVDEKDRSLLVPASEVWRDGSGTLRFLNRRYERPREALYNDLRRAALICPPIRHTLSSTWTPEYSELSPQEAYEFLKHTGFKLEQLGFVVLMPSVEQYRQRPTIRLRIAPQGETGRGLFNLESLLKYDWRVALGDETMDAEEFRRLVDLKAPLVSLRGKWVELDPEHISQVTGLLEGLGEGGTVSVARAICLSIGGGVEGHEAEIERVEVDGRLKGLLDLLGKSASCELLEPPAGFTGHLRPYQVRGVSWLYFLTKHGFGACLADDMGLGKTVQLLALALHYVENTPEKERLPMLIICPASVVYNWQRESKRFAPSLRVMVHHGSDRINGKEFASEAKRYDLVITTYALATRDSRVLSQVNWSGVVLDEAQNIKNPSTKQARTIKKLKALFRVALTGTPIENRLTELWSIMDFLNPGYLGSLKSFKANYAKPIERRHDIERAEQLRRVVGPFVLRRLKTDPAVIQDLPEKEEVKTYCNLTPEQATLYEALVQDSLRRIEESSGIQRRGLILSMLTGLKQICNHPVNFLKDNSPLEGRSGKLTRLLEMLEEVVASGDSALVFTQFVEMGELLKASLERALGCEVLFLHGKVPARQRVQMVDRFQRKDGQPRVFVLSLRAGGTGLNLTLASRVFHYDRWWNPAVETQATDRAFRIGQTSNVQVYKFICRGTLEERIDALIEEKKALAENVIGSCEDWITELTTDELRRLIALDAEAIFNE